jgi:hypothetical protein
MVELIWMSLSHVQDITIIEHLIFANLSQKIILFLGIFLRKFHHWISKSWEWTWPWIFMNNNCTYVWSAHKWKNWTICRHVYFLWCIITTKPIIKCTTTLTHKYMLKKNHVVCRFHYLRPFMHETKILKPLQINENYPFS